MVKTALAATIAAASLSLFALPAAACPAGYVAGWVQGNKVCHIKPGGNNTLVAQPKREPIVVSPAAKLLRR